MLKYGSDTCSTLRKLSHHSLWANEELPTTFYRLVQAGLATRVKENKQNQNGSHILMNRYSITSKGLKKVEEVETLRALQLHEERFFAF